MTLHERLLRLVLDEHKAAALLGDLEEDAARAGAGPRWVRRQAVRCALAAARHTIHRKKMRMLTTAVLALRDARRSIWRFRATSALAVLILTLSLAAGAVTFAVVDTVVLRPLPYPDSDRLVSISAVMPKEPRSLVAVVDYLSWRDGTSSFDSIAAWRMWPFRLNGGGTAQSVTMVITTASLFDVLQVKPVLGSLFTADNEVRGNDGVAVISHGLWQRRFGGDPNVLGERLTTPTGPVTIVGVMPRGFAFPVDAMSPPEIWRPLAPAPAERVLTPDGGRTSYLSITARLKDGVTLDQAQADILRVHAAFAADYPLFYTDFRPRAEFLLESLVDRVSQWMQLVLAAVAVLMVIACVNVSNLLLTTYTRRTRDVSVRISLGATRIQVLSALLTESLLLGAMATAAGLLLARWLLAIVTSALPAQIVRADMIQLDARVVGACATAGLLSALIAGLVPGWHASRLAPAQMVRDSSGATAGRRRWQSALLIAQVALVTVLIVGTTLLVGSFVRVVQEDLGFVRRNLAGVRLTVPAANGTPDAGRIRDFYARVEAAAAAVPGVTSVAMMTGGQLPLYRGFMTTRIGRAAAPDARISADLRRVSAGYFETAGIRLVEGRGLTAQDEGRKVGVLDTLGAGYFFPGRSALGERVTIGMDEEITIVGVAANVRLLGPEGDTQPQIYLPLEPTEGSRVLLVRTGSSVFEVAPSLQATLANVLPAGTAPARIDIVEEQFRRMTADRRFSAGIMSALGLLAFLIAGIGIYATTASMVAQRKKEIGIRIALGASPAAVVRGVTESTGRLLLSGAVIGLVISRAASGLVASVLYGVRPGDALPYIAPLLIMVVGGVIAALLPARRAARIDPLITLRTE